MVKLKKFLWASLLIAVSSNASCELLKIQMQNLSKAFSYGKNIKASDGMTFEYALSSILLAESSGGINVVDKTYDSLGAFQIRPHVAELLIEEFTPHYHDLLKPKNRKKLLDKLLNDFNFSMELAAHHLLKHYEEALQRNMKNPWKRTISRYNGGWDNTAYLEKIDKIKNFIYRLKKRGAIKDVNPLW